MNQESTYLNSTTQVVNIYADCITTSWVEPDSTTNQEDSEFRQMEFYPEEEEEAETVNDFWNNIPSEQELCARANEWQEGGQRGLGEDSKDIWDALQSLPHSNITFYEETLHERAGADFEVIDEYNDWNGPPQGYGQEFWRDASVKIQGIIYEQDKSNTADQIPEASVSQMWYRINTETEEVFTETCASDEAYKCNITTHAAEFGWEENLQCEDKGLLFNVCTQTEDACVWYDACTQTEDVCNTQVRYDVSTQTEGMCCDVCTHDSGMSDHSDDTKKSVTELSMEDECPVPRKLPKLNEPMWGDPDGSFIDLTNNGNFDYYVVNFRRTLRYVSDDILN